MYSSFTSHDTSKSTSSFGLIDYLDKENQAYEVKENELGESTKLPLEKENEHEAFFNGSYSELHTNQKIEIDEVVTSIDGNRGTQNLNQSNFYMLNISPKKTELEHMSKLADLELNNRGLLAHSDNEMLQKVYEEQKNELMKMQMKLYAKDVMSAYAANFNREIYEDESKLPDKKERKLIEEQAQKEFTSYLKTQGVSIKEKAKQTNSKVWVTKDSIEILEEKGNSYLVEISTEQGEKGRVYVPKKLLQEQEDKGKYKMPENLYAEKAQEIKNKNTLVELQASLKEVKELKNKEKVYNFEYKETAFDKPFKISFKESDLKKQRSSIDDLLNEKERFKVNKHLLEAKKNKALEANISLQYGAEKEKIFNTIASSKGYNVKKRQLTEKDLLWYGKVETQRTHKPTDTIVIKNKETLKEINKLSKHKVINGNKIKKLEATLIRDSNKEVIKSGLKKTGFQHHLHIVVSRHDNTMKKPEHKISLSPLANHKKGKMHNGATVGFERDKFYQDMENIFDKKFNYDRGKEERYDYYKTVKKERSKAYAENRSIKNVSVKAKGEAKHFLMNHTGVYQIKQNISPVQDIKKQLGIANIPTRIPKTPLQLAYKVGKKIIEKGLGY